MDRVRNPYAPGAGTQPPELAGRSAVLSDVEVVLSRIKQGRSSQSPILLGLRGVGKTVLLVRIKEMAEDIWYKTCMVEAHETRTLAGMLVPYLREILFSLSIRDAAKEKARRGLRVLKSFLSGLTISVGGVEMSIEAEVGTADSGFLEADLAALFLAVAEAAKAGETPVSILIDELQFLEQEEFSALIMACHRMAQVNLPMVVIGAGLPQIAGLAGEAKSYSERLFSFPPIGALEPNDAVAAIVNPAREEGAQYTDDALDEIMRITERYPYFLQQWGHDAWNIAAGPIITYENIKEATPAAIKHLDESFFRVRFDRCTPSERRYLRALAALGPGHHRSGDIAEKLETKVTSVGPARAKLIKKGMIYSPQHGDNPFTVPLFDAYMRRVMPDGP